MTHGNFSFLDSCFICPLEGLCEKRLAPPTLVNEILQASKAVIWALKSVSQSLGGILGKPRELSNSALILASKTVQKVFQWAELVGGGKCVNNISRRNFLC